MLRKTLQKYLIFFAAVPLLIVSVLVIPQMIRTTNTTSTELLRATTDYGAQSVDTFFAEALYEHPAALNHTVFERALKRSGLTKEGATYASNAETERANEELKNEVKRSPELLATMLVDKYDVVCASTLPHWVGRSFSADYIDQGSVGTKPYIAPIQEPEDIAAGPWSTDVIVTGVPILKNGEVIGRFVCFYSTDYFVRTVKRLSGEKQKIAIFDDTGTVVSDDSGLLTPSFLASKEGHAITNAIANVYNDQQSYQTALVTINGTRYEAVIHLPNIAKWPVVTIAPQSDLMGDTYRNIRIIVIASLSCLIIVFFLSTNVLDTLIGPLETTFLPALYRVANGDRKARIHYNREGEIGMIARALNDLMADLDERETQLQTSEARYRFVLEGNDFMVFEWDRNTDTIELSELFQKRFGLEPELTGVSHSLKDFRAIHPDDRVDFYRFCEDMFVRCVDSQIVMRIQRVSGDYIWTRCKSLALYDRNNECYGAVGVIADIDSTKREEIRLAEQVRTDTVSQVLTRKAFEDATNKLMYKVDQGDLRGHKLYVCFVDIDEFKDFNTQYGHAFGDRVIRFFGEVLKSSVGSFGYAGRVGGDEFALCFALSESDPSAQAIVDAVHERLNEGLRTRNTEENIVVTASVGLAEYPRDGKTYDELMHTADIDMYARKKSQKMQSRIDELQRLEAAGEEEPT